MRSRKKPANEPISEQVFLILLSLATGHKHGYAILKDVERLSQGLVQLSTSTLYGALGRLEEQGHVERVEASAEPTPGLPRKVYHLTPQGQALLNAESRRVQRLADMSRCCQVGDPA